MPERPRDHVHYLLRNRGSRVTRLRSQIRDQPSGAAPPMAYATPDLYANGRPYGGQPLAQPTAATTNDATAGSGSDAQPN